MASIGVVKSRHTKGSLIPSFAGDINAELMCLYADRPLDL